MSEQQDKTYELDGTRPIDSQEMTVADTFEDDGTRPIAESPDFLLQNQRSNQADQDSSIVKNEENLAIEAEPPSISDKRVVDTFEDDGTRPIMTNDYEVVANLGVDGNRPVTSESYIARKR